MGDRGIAATYDKAPAADATAPPALPWLLLMPPSPLLLLLLLLRGVY
jgi:hypothetical protein